MKIALVNRDLVFFPLVFGIWAIIIVVMHGNHSYFGVPLPGVDIEAGNSDASAASIDMQRARQALSTERNPKERGRILEALAVECFNRYRTQRSTPYLDSARYYQEGAVAADPGMSGYRYNLALICAEQKDFPSAKSNYAKTVAADPAYFMAYHNLGLLFYYQLHNSDSATACFKKALSIDSALPIDNYLLAEIAMGKHDQSAAVVHYKREVRIFADGKGLHASLVADPLNLRLAAALSALRLSQLYSTAFRDESSARTYFDEYLRLETDQARKRNSILEFQGRWPGSKIGP